jgi:hypothetical protein
MENHFLIVIIGRQKMKLKSGEIFTPPPTPSPFRGEGDKGDNVALIVAVQENILIREVKSG